MAQDFILFAVAVLPSLFIADYIYKHDNTDVEPMGLLRSLFLLGAASCLPAALVEQVLDGFLVDAFGSTSYAYILLDYFVVVAGAEEGFKYLVLHWRTWKDPAFDHRFDGIVYTVMVGLGFATLENIMYVFQYGLGTGIVRAFLSVPGHAGWGVIMGYYYGRMKMFDTLGDQAQYKRARIAALAVPMLCHGLYDTLMSLPGDMLPFLVGVGFAIAIDVGVIKLIKSESQSDTVLLKQSGAQWGFSYYGAPTPAPAPAPAYAPAPAPQAAPGWQPAPRSAQPYAQQPAPAPQPAATYAQQPVSAPQPAAAYAQRPASVSQPAATYTQQRVPQPTYLYGQEPATPPQYASAYPQQPAPAAKPSKGFLGKWIGGYLGLFVALFIVAIVVDYGFLQDLIITICAFMVMAAVPYLAIVIFAWRMRVNRERRIAQGNYYGSYPQMPQAQYPQQPQAQYSQQPVQYPQQTRR
ncbi:MAG: PrsW family glutamic-type intramembrane protease [Olegusella sp.]|nr:PrsW family glutamic-type intramembrane protease [Olegusella sp.]